MSIKKKCKKKKTWCFMTDAVRISCLVRHVHLLLGGGRKRRRGKKHTFWHLSLSRLWKYNSLIRRHVDRRGLGISSPDDNHLISHTGTTWDINLLPQLCWSHSLTKFCSHSNETCPHRRTAHTALRTAHAAMRTGCQDTANKSLHLLETSSKSLSQHNN